MQILQVHLFIDPSPTHNSLTSMVNWLTLKGLRRHTFYIFAMPIEA